MPHNSVGVHSFHCPPRRKASPSAKRRAAEIIKPKARSAVVSVNTSGVFVTVTPHRVHSATSMLSYPTAMFATIRSPGPAASSNSASTFSDNKVRMPSTPCTLSSNSPRGIVLSDA